MKTTGTRSLILVLLTIAFAGGMLLFLVEFVRDGGSWAIQPFNKHITQGESLSGRVLDCNGTVLAYSDETGRVYHDDQTVRLAMLHTVGDTRGYIATSAQYLYRADLSGYNLVTGLVSPFGKSNGSDVKLTLDADLCETAYEALGGKKGAVVVYNYKTGAVLCEVSTPSFDPGAPPADLDTDETGKYEGVYLNNVLSSTYTPGSVFKVVTTAAAIENIPDLDSRTFTCNGSVVINGNQINCLATHGQIDFKTALSHSCNVVFGELAVELGEGKMTEMANQMGFNTSFEFDGIHTAKSVYQVKGASDDALAWSGIGQYTDLANPMHMAILMGAVANGGTPVLPHFVESITTSFGLVTRMGYPQEGERMLSVSTADRLKGYLRNNVSSYYGDNLFPSGMEVCAKTGTAEVGEGKAPTGWMIGFSANSATPYAFAVAVEEGSSGIGSAGSVASAVLNRLAA